MLIFYGLFLVFSYGIAAILTGVFIRSGLNRLLYSNIALLNDNIVDSLENAQSSDFSLTLQTARQYTGVDLLVYRNGFIYYSSLPSTSINVSEAVLVSEQYNVYRLIDGMDYYYFTSSYVFDGEYHIYVFRLEGSLMVSNEAVFLMSFIGVVFLAISISVISVFSAKSFALPARTLADYVDKLSLQEKPGKRPHFSILEYDELSDALEKAHMRIYQYSEAEKEFLHNFSHELKTPLTNIYSYAEALYYGVMSENDSKNSSLVIMKESEKLKDFINQVLYLGRIDSIGEKMNVTRINIIDVLGDAMNSADIQAKDKKISIEFRHEQENIYIYADPDKLEVAFGNLFTNAIRYAKKQIVVSVKPSKDFVEIAIDDDGIGIDKNIRDQIWERYFIGKEGHTGLGLTITKSIIEKHEGDIFAEDSPLGGARFVIRLPLNKKIVVSL